jgi:two-component system sensor histidine kinase UhpB
MTARRRRDTTLATNHYPAPSTEAVAYELDRSRGTAPRANDEAPAPAADRALQRVVEQLKQAEHVAKLGSWEWDIRTGELTWSDELYRIFGLHPGAWLPSASGFFTRIHPDDVATVGNAVSQALNGGRPFHTEYRIVRADGSICTVEARGELQVDRDGRPERMMGTAADVTERKAAERALLESREQLRSLADRLAAVREEERARISREIHDELGQALTALKFELAWLRDQSEGASLERIAAMDRLIDGTASAVRRIANDLRPGILDALGLAAAIEWEAEQFAARTGIACRVRILDECSDLDEKRSTTLFRALQEALTNVARHAQAQRVVIRLRRWRGAAELSVADDGRGIASADPPRLGGGLGLVGMAERARACGGTTSIARRRGRGTVLTMRLPS